MEMPAGLVDPIFLHELALELHMPVGEMCNRMSAHELAVQWPAYFAWRAAKQENERARDEMLKSGRGFGSG